jgi:hypothetical protein
VKRPSLDALAGLAAGVSAAAGLTLVLAGLQPQPRPSRSPAAAAREPVSPPSRPGTVPEPGTVHEPRTASAAPLRVDAPAIGLHARIQPVGVAADGSIEVPSAGLPSPAGWYRYFPAPGDVGAAILVGHVDSARDGPAVFFRLGDLRPSDLVTVTRSDRRIVRFRVRAMREYPRPASRPRRSTAGRQVRSCAL